MQICGYRAELTDLSARDWLVQRRVTIVNACGDNGADRVRIKSKEEWHLIQTC